MQFQLVPLVVACLVAFGAHGVHAQEASPVVPGTTGEPVPGIESGTPLETLAAAESVSERFYDFRLADDLRALPSDMGHDLLSLISVSNAVHLGLGGALAAVSANNWDDEVRANTARHARRFGGFNNVMDVAGHPALHVGIGTSLYATSLVRDEPRLHDASTALLHALLLTDVSVLGLKAAFDTTRPNGDSQGFPSGHAASSFAAAAVLEDRCGPNWGLAGYITAGLIAWHRIDDRQHDLSDVIFGAALGYTIGKSVAQSHRLRAAGFEIAPYADTETTGMLFHRRF